MTQSNCSGIEGDSATPIWKMSIRVLWEEIDQCSESCNMSSPVPGQAIARTMSLCSPGTWANCKLWFRRSKKVREPHSSPATIVFSLRTFAAEYTGCFNQKHCEVESFLESHTLTLLSCNDFSESQRLWQSILCQALFCVGVGQNARRRKLVLAWEL